MKTTYTLDGAQGELSAIRDLIRDLKKRAAQADQLEGRVEQLEYALEWIRDEAEAACPGDKGAVTEALREIASRASRELPPRG